MEDYFENALFGTPFTAAVIVAAGSSQRMGGEDKQFIELCGKPVLARSMAAFQRCPIIEEIVVVTKPSSVEAVRKMAEKYGIDKLKAVVEGGANRAASVRNGVAAVSAAAEKTTLVTVETDMSAWGAAASVSMDHRALGEALGAAALNGVPAGETVLLLDSLPGDNGVRESLDAARAVLEEAGRQVRIGAWGTDSASLDDAAGAERPSAVIAFEASALADMAELARGEKRFPLLYGCGSTPAIAAALEKGRVTAIAAVNTYSAGYLAVEATAALARHERWTDVPSVAFSVVRKETMYDSDNQKLLFPVT